MDTSYFYGIRGIGDLNHSMRQTGGLSLAAGWTAATQYEVPGGNFGSKSHRPPQKRYQT